MSGQLPDQLGYKVTQQYVIQKYRNTHAMLSNSIRRGELERATINTSTAAKDGQRNNSPVNDSITTAPMRHLTSLLSQFRQLRLFRYPANIYKHHTQTALI